MVCFHLVQNFFCNGGFFTPTKDNTTQHNTRQHNTTQHNTTQHNTAQHLKPGTYDIHVKRRKFLVYTRRLIADNSNVSKTAVITGFGRLTPPPPLSTHTK
jgi:hypothetical protein